MTLTAHQTPWLTIPCSALFSGQYGAVKGLLSCDACAEGLDSAEGSTACDLAFREYYRTALTFASSNLTTVAKCPNNARCYGGHLAPAPKKGYW